MPAKTLEFLLLDDGAVTTDWVILTGATVAMAVIMMSTMNSGISSVGTEIETVITDVEVVEIGAIGFSQ